MSDNKVIENRPVAEVVIDEKSKKAPKQITRKEAQAIVDKYEKACKPFKVRMIKFKRKEKELKEWVKSFPEEKKKEEKKDKKKK